MNSARRGLLLLIGLVLCIAAGIVVISRTMDPDAFWHLLVAGQLRKQGIGPIVDHLSFSSIKQPWTPYSWLAELGMKEVWDWFGYRGAILVHVLLQMGFLVFVAMACAAFNKSEIRISKSETNPKSEFQNSKFSIVLITILAAILSIPYLSFRPAAMAIVLLAAVAWLLLRDRRSGENTYSIWLIVPITALLVNIHLFAILVPLWIVSLWIGALIEKKNIHRYGLLLLLCLLACCLTPMLGGTLMTLRHYELADVMVGSAVIAEFQPFHQGVMGKIALGFILLMLLLTLRNRKNLRAGEWIILIGSLAMLPRGGRYAPLFVMMGGPILGASLPRLSARPLEKPVMQFALASLVVACLVRITIAFPGPNTSLSDWLNRNGPDTPGYPCAAADYVADHIKPVHHKLLNEFTWGGYLEWRLGDRYQTLLDGRTQCFSADFWRTIYFTDDAKRAEFFRTIDADAAILPTGKSTFRTALTMLKWERVYKDDFAEVWIPNKTSASSAPLR